MKKNLVRSFLIFQFIFVLSACSSLDGLRFWNTDEVDPDEPRALEAFSNKKIISLEWSKSFNGKNEIGNFEPDFSSNKIFFADTDGSVYSIQSETANKTGQASLIFCHQVLQQASVSL